MFKDENPLADVSIEVDIKTDMVLSFYNDYLRLVRVNGLGKIYDELKNDFHLFLHIYNK